MAAGDAYFVVTVPASPVTDGTVVLRAGKAELKPGAHSAPGAGELVAEVLVAGSFTGGRLEPAAQAAHRTLEPARRSSSRPPATSGPPTGSHRTTASPPAHIVR